MDPATSLSPAERLEVLALVDAVTAADAVRPLNDEAMLALDRDGDRHWLLLDHDETGPNGAMPAGYAYLSSAFGTAQLAVRPDRRREGHGRELVDAVRAAGATGIWAFGNLPGAQALAEASGLANVRGLLIMERPLDPEHPEPNAPHGITLRAYTDGDADAFLAVNAAAFAHHPEQGAFSAHDLAARQAEYWWDPAGLIVAEDAAGLVGFHWTKRHDAEVGEVYVIGVHPRAQGLGLGGVLLDAGLAHLAASGCTRVILYVEADNPAVHLYERNSFRVVHTDVLYA